MTHYDSAQRQWAAPFLGVQLSHQFLARPKSQQVVPAVWRGDAAGAREDGERRQPSGDVCGIAITVGEEQRAEVGIEGGQAGSDVLSALVGHGYGDRSAQGLDILTGERSGSV